MYDACESGICTLLAHTPPCTDGLPRPCHVAHGEQAQVPHLMHLCMIATPSFNGPLSIFAGSPPWKGTIPWHVTITNGTRRRGRLLAAKVVAIVQLHVFITVSHAPNVYTFRLAPCTVRRLYHQLAQHSPAPSLFFYPSFLPCTQLPSLRSAISEVSRLGKGKTRTTNTVFLSLVTQKNSHVMATKRIATASP